MDPMDRVGMEQLQPALQRWLKIVHNCSGLCLNNATLCLIRHIIVFLIKHYVEIHRAVFHSNVLKNIFSDIKEHKGVIKPPFSEVILHTFTLTYENLYKVNSISQLEESFLIFYILQ